LDEGHANGVAWATWSDPDNDSAGGAKRAEILNEVHGRSKYLIEDYKNAALRYADRKFFGNKLDVHPVIVTPIPNGDTPENRHRALTRILPQAGRAADA
jgi:hypothetical protein